MEKVDASVCFLCQFLGPSKWSSFDFFKAQRGEANLICGFRSMSGGPLVTHLQFADDAIILCEAKEEEVRNEKVIMLCFEVVMGLKVNFF